jgi:hypothetical protein
MARAAYMGDLRACTCALVILALHLVGRDGLSSSRMAAQSAGDRKLKESTPRLAPGRPQPPTIVLGLR